jgi:hypothetical protein
MTDWEKKRGLDNLAKASRIVETAGEFKAAADAGEELVAFNLDGVWLISEKHPRQPDFLSLRLERLIAAEQAAEERLGAE